MSYGSLVVLLIWGSGIMGSTWMSAANVGLAMFCVVVRGDPAGGFLAWCVMPSAWRGSFGEPYGTLILTLSVIGLEVIMIATVMVTGENVPTMARDTMFAVMMIVLNGLLGVSIFVGAWKHRLQEFQHPVIAHLHRDVDIAGGDRAGLAGGSCHCRLKEDAFHYFLIVGGVVMYGIFLWVQTVEHRGFFEYHASGREDRRTTGMGDSGHRWGRTTRSC